MHAEKLLHYLPHAEFEQLLAAGAETIAKGLLVLSDKPLLFIYLSAMVSWVRMLPPPYMNELLGEISAEVLINLLLCLATAGMGMAIRMSAQVLGGIKSRRARQWRDHMTRQFGKAGVEEHAQLAKPILLSSAATPIKTIPDVPLKAWNEWVSNPVAMLRWTRFCRLSGPACIAPVPWKWIAGWGLAGVTRWRIGCRLRVIRWCGPTMKIGRLPCPCPLPLDLRLPIAWPKRRFIWAKSRMNGCWLKRHVFTISLTAR